MSQTRGMFFEKRFKDAIDITFLRVSFLQFDSLIIFIGLQPKKVFKKIVSSY